MIGFIKKWFGCKEIRCKPDRKLKNISTIVQADTSSVNEVIEIPKIRRKRKTKAN